MMKYWILFFGLILVPCLSGTAQTKHATKSKFMSYKGLVMAGYQGWFNCEGDGATEAGLIIVKMESLRMEVVPLIIGPKWMNMK